MPKNIVFCADGTWNHPGETDGGLVADTNVYKFYKALLKTAGQDPHYDDGVGVNGTPIDQLLGGAFGDGLLGKIKDGYTTIARNYQDGDGIYIFGFSRGAYTARSLAGMIAVAGLPAPGKFDDQATDAAFQVYRKLAPLDAFTAKYQARDVKIAMVGVWDTVGALGIPGLFFAGLDKQFFGFLSTDLHPDVQAAYHAVSVDERRNEFPATLWTDPDPAQALEQTWFAGVHGDVGGGYAQTGLSDITLAWMMLRANGNGLKFDDGVFQTYADLDPKHALDLEHESWSPIWLLPQRRLIAEGSTLANSVVVRLNGDPTYRPPNLPTRYSVDVVISPSS
jgi:uncharacterized protein (DUF2235 family)